MAKEEKTTKKAAAEETSEKQALSMLKQADVEKLVLEAHKEGLSPAKIGLLLRDKHGVPKAKLFGRRITQIIHDAKSTVVAERTHVERKIKVLETHQAKHAHDYCAQRSLTKKLWLVRTPA